MWVWGPGLACIFCAGPCLRGFADSCLQALQQLPVLMEQEVQQVQIGADMSCAHSRALPRTWEQQLGAKLKACLREQPGTERAPEHGSPSGSGHHSIHKAPCIHHQPHMYCHQL